MHLLRMLSIAAMVLGVGCAATGADDAVDDEGLELSAQSVTCSSFGKGWCRRPRVNVVRDVAAIYDANGALGGTVAPGEWSVSACTEQFCSVYRKGGKLFVVSRVALLENSAKEARGVTRLEAVRMRTMKTTTTKPSGKTLITTPFDIPEPGQPRGFAPPDGDGVGSNESLSCRGPKCAVWGVETPTNRPGSGTGYAGFLLLPGTEVIDAGERAYGAPWVDATGAPRARAKWALVWTKVGDAWARQWLLMEVSPYDGSKPYVLLRDG